MGYEKKDDEKFSLCLHNTTSIPDEYVMTQDGWVPDIDMSEAPKKKMRARVYKVHRIIMAASTDGRFVSKEWLCAHTGCGKRTMTKVLIELQNTRVVCGLIAVRHAHNYGYFYRMDGKKWTKKIQNTHAKLRRGKPADSMVILQNVCKSDAPGGNGDLQKLCKSDIKQHEICTPNTLFTDPVFAPLINRVMYNSIKGSLSREPVSSFSQNGEVYKYSGIQIASGSGYEKIINNKNMDDEALKSGFVRTKIRRIKNRPRKMLHSNGLPGDGLDGTCYTALGCAARLSSDAPLSEYSEMIAPLLNAAAAPATFSASIARSACRRIDSGIMTPVAVQKVVEYLVSKNIVQPMYILIRDFDYYLKKCLPEKIDYSELPGLSVHIDAMILGSPASELQNTLLKARDRLTTSLNTLLESDNAGMLAPSKIINTILFNSVDPLWAQLAALLDFASFPDATINTVVDYYADKLHDDIAKDKNVFELFRKHEQRRKLLGKTKLIDWFDVATHTRKYATDLRSSLNMNGLEHVALNAYCENIKEDTIVNVIPYSPTCILR